MKVAITGGTGFAGRYLARLHQEAGDGVHILSRKKVRDSGTLRFFQADLTDSNADLDGFLAGVEVLYHCAAELKDERLMEDLHVRGTQNLLRSARGRVRRWVQLSSVGVYGQRREGAVNEKSDCHPVGIYENTKYDAEKLVASFCRKNDMPFCILRPSIVIGTDMPSPIIRAWIHYIRKGLYFFVGPCGTVRNYIPVENLARALRLCGTHPNAKGETFIISEPILIERAVDVFCEALSIRPVRWRLPEFPVRLLASAAQHIPGFPLGTARIDALTCRMTYESKKIHELLGYAPVKSLETSLREIAASSLLRSNPKL